MVITKELPCGKQVRIIVGIKTEQKFKGTCFRGKNRRFAGNFKIWDRVEKLLGDTFVLKTFITCIQQAIDEEDFSNQSCTIRYSYEVGWSLTNDLSKYFGRDLIRFRPTPRSLAYKVKPERRNMPAPLTNQITLVFDLKNENDLMVVIVHDIYPGKDVGDLTGDISAREKCAFFDRNHPGAAPHQRQ